MKRSQSMKIAFMGGVVALVVLFGIDIATSGVERIYGPMDDGGALPVNRLQNGAGAYGYGEGDASAGAGQDGYGYSSGSRAYDQAARAQAEDDGSYRRPLRTVGEAERGKARGESYEDEQSAPENERLPGIPDQRRDPSVNQLADGTAGLLQSVSSQGIRFIVSFFDSITD